MFTLHTHSVQTRIWAPKGSFNLAILTITLIINYLTEKIIIFPAVLFENSFICLNTVITNTECGVSQEVTRPNSIHCSKERPSLKLSNSSLREANLSK